VVGGRDKSSAPPESIDWWHRFEKLLSLHLPDLTGKTVLDVGPYDGYFSLTAERFGASRVVTVDTASRHDRNGSSSSEYIKDAIASKAEDLKVHPLDISPEIVGQFDVVLFLGVLCHMRDPLLALERMASVTKELLVVETLVDLGFVRSPAAAFYPRQMLRDETNWWGPNPQAVVGMLHTAGFKQVVAYPLEHLSTGRIAGLPARAKRAIDLACSTPCGSRGRLLRDFARHVLMQNHLVTHGWRHATPAHM
jgi:tRNA (mo5U34)-methyltransferase